MPLPSASVADCLSFCGVPRSRGDGGARPNHRVACLLFCLPLCRDVQMREYLAVVDKLPPRFEHQYVFDWSSCEYTRCENKNCAHRLVELCARPAPFVQTWGVVSLLGVACA